MTMNFAKLITDTKYRAQLDKWQENPDKCRDRLTKWFPNGPFAFVHDDHILSTVDTLLGIIDDEDIPNIERYLTQRTHRYRSNYDRAKRAKTDYFYRTNQNPSIDRGLRQRMEEDDVDYDCVLERLRLTIDEERHRSGYYHGQYECDLWLLSQMYAYKVKAQRVAPVA